MTAALAEASAPKTGAQLRTIYALARQRDLDTDALHQLVADETGQTSIKALTFDQANKVIARLRGGQPGYGWCDPKATPLRTVQHRRARAGVVQVITPAQRELLADLAAGRSMSVEGLRSLAKRMSVPYPPRTTRDANKLIEAIKKMNERGAACR